MADQQQSGREDACEIVISDISPVGRDSVQFGHCHEGKNIYIHSARVE